MKTIKEIVCMPTALLLTETNPIPAVGIHENNFRAYRVLEKVRALLESNAPPEVILELIEFFDGLPEVRKQL